MLSERDFYWLVFEGEKPSGFLDRIVYEIRLHCGVSPSKMGRYVQGEVAQWICFEAIKRAEIFFGEDYNEQIHRR